MRLITPSPPPCPSSLPGAAPGDHINLLSEEFFPDLQWLLVDPAPFACVSTDKITLLQEYFSDELAASLRAEALRDGHDLLFLSDVRSTDTAHSGSDREARISADMQWQEKWVRMLQPTAAMLKFRLPYTSPGKGDSERTRYLDGDLYLPVWGGRTTTETRLVVTDPVRAGRVGRRGERVPWRLLVTFLP